MCVYLCVHALCLHAHTSCMCNFCVYKCLCVCMCVYVCVCVPANKEPFLNQLVLVILVHNWYQSNSTCFLVYSLNTRVLPVVMSFEQT